MAERFYVDFHVLQTVPPSNLNRDDMGSPKTAVYGGVTRARVSSQAWKRAMRVYFRKNSLFTLEQMGERTKRIVEKVAEQIHALDTAADAEKMAVDALNYAIGTPKKKKPISEKNPEEGTGALFFLADREATELARLIVSKEKNAEKYKAVLKTSSHPSVDIALFGRMVADDPSLNYDAAAQVAHSISTHTVQNEYDYFTAVDDRSPEDNAGAGHLGTVEYNSSTLYRYATVNVTELLGNLGSETAHAVRGFAEAFIQSMPTGKQNTFANRTPAAMVYVTIRRDQPVNLVGAFETPVRKNQDGGYEVRSEEQFVQYAKKVYQDFTSEPELALGSSLHGKLTELPGTAISSVPKLLDTLEEEVAKRLDSGKGKQ